MPDEHGNGTPFVTDVAAMAAEAERMLSVGRVAEAQDLCRMLLSASAEHPTALMILSVVGMSEGRWEEAEGWLSRGCVAHPEIVGFHVALAQVRQRLNERGGALDSLESCVVLEPARRDHRVKLIGAYQTRVFSGFSDKSKAAMLICLADESLTHSSMHRAWLSLLRADPEAAPIFDLFDGALDYPSFRERVARAPELLRAIQDHQLLQRGLERFLAADVAVERGLTFTRRWFLEHRREPGGSLPLLCSLARYCFFTEYVFAVEEDPRVLDHEDLSTPEAAALLACYQPLAEHPRAEEIARLSVEPCYRELVRTLISEPREERDLKAAIPTLTPISDEVSRAVQRQYEDSPYPRWTTVEGPSPGASDIGARGGSRTILMAGCGTGREAVEAASRFPAAHVDALDLSRASLAYGARKARDMNLENLAFGQADILRIPDLERRYDLIVAVGVLHHMRDPRAGLRALLAVLRPGGIVRVALYSQIARTAVVEARAFIQAAGFPPTPHGIRDFRAAIVARPIEDPVRAWLLRSYDFYSLSQCRDLVFHVHEETFTLPQIAKILREFRLSLLRLDVRSPVHLAAYREHFPHDPEAIDLANWHQLEQQTPAIFAGMYSLWLCRSAEAGTVDASWIGGGDRGAA